MAAQRPIDIYIRVSRIGPRQHLISPEVQEERARGLLAARGLPVGVVLPADLDESGAQGFERPGLQEALNRVQRGVSGGVCVAWLDRLTRDSPEHAHRLIREIHEAGGAVYAPDAPEDWTTPEGELQVSIVLAFSSYVRRRAKAGFARAKEQAIERGIPVHTRPAVGYRTREDRRLEPDPVTAPIVAEVFARRVQGHGPTALAEFLEENGVTTSQGSKTWSKEAIYGLLRNRVYLGELSYGGRKVKRDPELPQLPQLITPRYENKASHEPIVDLPTWLAAQASHAAPWRNTSRVHLLSGLLRCATCRHALQGTDDSHGHPIYRCKRRHAGGMCLKPVRARAEGIETLVLRDMWAHMPRLRSRGVREADDSRVAELIRAAAEARKLIQEWAAPAMQAAMIGTPDIYAEGMTTRTSALARAEAALAAERQVAAATADLPDAVSLREAWLTMSVPDRVGLLRTRYDCIALRRNPDMLVLYPFGLGPDDLPRQGYRREPTLRPFNLDDLPDGVRIARF